MKRTVQTTAWRLGCAFGLTGSWMLLSGATPGFSPAPPASVLLLAQAEATEMPVSFATEQAARGEERYTKDCEECHGEDLRGGLNGGAPLRGRAFEEKFLGDLPASVLFAYMSDLMPPNAPGRFSPSIYADLMAYVLKRNGFQPGEPLPSDIDTLDAMVMTK